ncbi:GD14684 [Drosophila simulans]|uniref:GD14684 n=1 Tax=Drosophila simulans TaxID=7240 RepID=B4QND6_DROSI|nr:GD14684 [Drosophila simulans]
MQTDAEKSGGAPRGGGGGGGGGKDSAPAIGTGREATTKTGYATSSTIHYSYDLADHATSHMKHHITITTTASPLSPRRSAAI